MDQKKQNTTEKTNHPRETVNSKNENSMNLDEEVEKLQREKLSAQQVQKLSPKKNNPV